MTWRITGSTFGGGPPGPDFGASFTNGERTVTVTTAGVPWPPVDPANPGASINPQNEWTRDVVIETLRDLIENFPQIGQTPPPPKE